MKRYFNISQLNKNTPAVGRVLISEPFLSDNFFKRSVVYLCEHNEDGSFGFVLNNALTVDICDVMEGFNTHCDFQIGFGGPVNSSNLYYLHTLGDKIEGAEKVTEGLYTGGDFDQIKALINAGLICTSELRFFLGYSGWTAGQLEQEIKENSWIVSDEVALDIITSSNKSLWQKALNDMGGEFKVLANFPEDPTLN